MLNRFISEGHSLLHTFSLSDRINFSEAESNAICYGVMATLAKHGIALDSTNGIESAADKFLANQDWSGCTDFRRECVTNWTKLFATRDVEWSESTIGNFLSLVDHLSCNADTYVSLGGSSGCADQLTNWDGTQKVGLGAVPRKKNGNGLSI